MLLLFKSPENTTERIRQADALKSIVDTEVMAMTGLANVLKRHKALPIVVAEIGGDGYWYLRFNDPEFANPQELRDMVKKWEHSPFLTGKR